MQEDVGPACAIETGSGADLSEWRDGSESFHPTLLQSHEQPSSFAQLHSVYPEVATNNCFVIVEWMWYDSEVTCDSPFTYRSCCARMALCVHPRQLRVSGLM